MGTINLFPDHACLGAVTIGNFDGVHIGHQRILTALRAMADRLAGPSVVFTFDPPPSVLLHPDRLPRPLTTVAQRDALLRDHGVDEIVLYPTDRAMLMWSDHEFFDRVICTSLGARGIVEGSNFRFGRDRQGDVSRLMQLCQSANMQCEIVSPVVLSAPPTDGSCNNAPRTDRTESAMAGEAVAQIVSSSAIRQFLSGGDVERAARMLGRPHQLQGTVVRGRQRGATLGFPTANLNQYQVVAPAAGVYAGKAYTANRWFLAAIHVGPAPTFQSEEHQLEVHLLDFQGDLYGQRLDVTFEHRLRDTCRFDSLEKLREQLSCDVRRVRQLLQGPPSLSSP